MKSFMLAAAALLSIASIADAQIYRRSNFDPDEIARLKADGFVMQPDGSAIKTIPFESSPLAFRNSRIMGAAAAASLPNRNPNPVPPIAVGDPRQSGDPKAPGEYMAPSRPSTPIRGPAGPAGPQGPKGEKGDKGDRGEVSEEQIAAIVANIVQQLRSDPALKGEKGDRGPAGPAGPQGPRGDDGRDAIVDPDQLAAELPPIVVQLVDDDGNVLDERTVPLGGVLKLNHRPIRN